ncbi:MAG: T9SS type A sorting domain-containing protein [Bacteroidota bacterium]
MKTFLLFFFLIIFSFFLQAQEVISSYGLDTSNSSGNLSATAGEVTIATLNNGSYQITQGFHQTSLAALAVEDFDENFKVKIYPNPSSELFLIDIMDFTDIHYKIYSVNGQLLYKNELKQQSNTVKVDRLKNGLYFLTLYKNNQKIKTYKILKN